MKKNVMMALVALGCCAGANAQVSSGANANDKTHGTYKTETSTKTETSVNKSSSSTPQQNELIKIRSTELPAMVTQTLGNSDYQGWTVSNAYRTKTNDQYMVEVKKESQTKTYWFDKNGNKTESVKTTVETTKTGMNGATKSETDVAPGSMESGSPASGTESPNSSGSGTPSQGSGTNGTGTGY